MRRILFSIPILIILGLFFFFREGLHQDPRELPSTLIHQPAPVFSLPELNAERRQTQKIFLRHLTLLNVWASWCESCEKEQAFLMTLHQKYPKLQIIGLNYKDDPAQARTWLLKFGNPYQMILKDLDGSTGINYGVYGTPESFLINPQGLIIAKHVGVLDEKSFEILSQLG